MVQAGSFITEHLSLGRAFGLQAYTFRRLLLLTSCILGIFQYGMVLTNGCSVDDFNSYYGLTEKEGDTLYSFLNFGACALSFVPGLCYDRVGCVFTMALGVLVFDAGIGLQLVWTQTFPSWLSTMDGLKFCYTCFGFASSFFNVIGSFAPLAAYPTKDVGKISACVQVCMSLGITVQTQAYYLLQGAVGSDGDPVSAYLWYSLIFTNITGVFMCIVFRACRKVLTTEPVPCEHQPEPPARSLCSLLLTADFAYYTVLFFIAVGFSFSFLDVYSRMAAEVGVSAQSLGSTFGILNALGRLAVSIPLDYTRGHPLGGVYSYLAAALTIFMCGMLFLVLPASPSSSDIVACNAFASFGYGCMLGIVPPALRLKFGTDHLGVLYGILYIGVSVSEPLWTLLVSKPDGCSGVECYRAYNLSCVLGFAITILLTLLVLRREVRESTRSAITLLERSDCNAD